MFGLIYFADDLIARTIGLTGKHIEDSITKKETLNKETGLCNDSQMNYYDSTMGGKRVIFQSQNMGRAVTRDIRTYKVLRDLTQEAMNKELAYYRANPDPNHTVVQWSTRADIPDSHGLSEMNKPYGTRYKDIETGAIYVRRNFVPKASSCISCRKNKAYREMLSQYPLSTFYMDINTGMLVRVADGTYDETRKIRISSGKYSSKEIEKEIEERKEIDEKWIKKFNKDQEKWIKKGIREVDGYKFYWNHAKVDW